MKWMLSMIGRCLSSPACADAERLVADLRHNLKLLDDLAGRSRMRRTVEIELEATRVELLEAYSTIASLVSDLEFERSKVTYLEERLTDFEDDIKADRRSRPALRIVSVNRDPTVS